jgi:hypothetical protein
LRSAIRPEAPMTAAYQQTTPPAPFSAAREVVDRMVEHLQSVVAMGKTHGELEEYITEEGREFKRRMMQGHLDLRAAAEQRVGVTGADGEERRARRRLGRSLLSIFGRLNVERFAYQAEGAAGLFPLDGSLNLPPELYSHGVRQRAAEEAARGSFEEVVDVLAKTTGAPVNKRQVEELAERAARDFDDFYVARPVNDVEGEDPLLVLTFDAAGIVMLKADLRPATRKAAEKAESDPRWPKKRLSKGEKRNRKRMAQVAAVYSIAPFPRTPQDIVHELRPVQDVAAKKQRPKPVNKRVWSSIAKEPMEVVREAFREAKQRDPERRRPWVVLVDGNEAQLQLVYLAAAEVGVEVTVILDVIHVLEYLWKAAYCFHKDGTPEAEGWVTKRLMMLLEGVDASNVAAGMTRSATLHELERREAVDDCAAYLRKYRDILNYADALDRGFPIATGVVEGACRYLIRDRMDKTGARWSLHGAEAVLKLRALYAGGDFDAYWQFHLRAEHQRHHASKYLDGVVPSTLPSPKAVGRLRLVK